MPKNDCVKVIFPVDFSMFTSCFVNFILCNSLRDFSKFPEYFVSQRLSILKISNSRKVDKAVLYN